MGRKVVVELKCDRCRKVEHVSQETTSAKGPIFSCSFMGNAVTYEDLCTGCREVVATHWADITRDMKKVTPRRTNAGREAAMAKVTGPQASAPAAPPIPHKAAPGLGERKTDSPGSSQRP